MFPLIFRENDILHGLLCDFIFKFFKIFIVNIALVHSFSMLLITQVLKGNGFNRVVMLKLFIAVAHSKTFIVDRYACTYTPFSLHIRQTGFIRQYLSLLNLGVQ